jgi:hypothetical protein
MNDRRRGPKTVDNFALERLSATVKDVVFALVCTGLPFYDSKSGKGGGRAISLAVHLLRLELKRSATALRERRP